MIGPGGLTRPSDEVGSAIAELRAAVNDLAARRLVIGPWRITARPDGALVATHRDTGVERVIALP